MIRMPQDSGRGAMLPGATSPRPRDSGRGAVPSGAVVSGAVPRRKRDSGGGAVVSGAVPWRKRDSGGGAVSLWVLVMVPVLALAGVAAIAVPERMAAEAAVTEVADDLAALAVVWREGTGVELRTLDGFPPDCAGTSDVILAARCGELWEPMLTDLAGAGVDVMSVAGYYSDSYAASTSADRLPCRRYTSSIVLDAAHVALVADWYGGWAASQIWPDGVRLGAEAVGRLSVAFAEQYSAYTSPPRESECGERLNVLNAYGEPGWLRDPAFAGREMAESVSFRTPFGNLRPPAGTVQP